MRNLSDAFPNLVERNVHRPFYCPERRLVFCPHVDECDILAVAVSQLSPVERLHPAGDDVLCYVSRYCNGVFRRREWRCVCMFQTCEVAHRRFLLYGKRILVDACVNPLESHYLRPVEPSGVGSECNLYLHLPCAGIVAGVRGAVYRRREERNAHLSQTFCRQSCCRHGDVEHLCDGGAYCALIFFRVSPDHVVSHDARLPVCRSGEEVQPRLSRDGVREFYGVAYGIHILHGCLQKGVHLYASRLSYGNSRRACEACLCPHSDRQEHDVGFEGHSRFQSYDSRLPSLLERFHRLP